MKRHIFLSLSFFLLSCSLSAQNFYMQYSHDTLGNRTSRVRGVLTREMEPELLNADTLLADYHLDDSFVALVSNGSEEIWSEKDTSSIKQGCLLIKTRAEKEAYLREIMASTAALEPIQNQSRSRESNNTYDVGAIPLQFGVSQSGARTYSIPIATAPDIKYSPSLSLVYNSQGGYGYGGYGWDLSGLSSISLVSRSLYYDDTIKGANAADTSAVFSLDGIRLVRNTDSATSSSYPLVTATGHILASPVKNTAGYVRYFNVLYPDGVRATFGSDSLNAGSQMIAYPLVESVNIDGDKIRYVYSFDSTDDSYYLKSVKYGFDALGNASGHISFQVTNNAYYNYYAGKKQRRNPRINSIVSTVGGETLYSYGLTYTTAANTELLTGVTLANSENGELPPLEFTYGVVDPHIGNDTLKVSRTIELTDSHSQGYYYRRGKFVQGCFNDGLVLYPIRRNYMPNQDHTQYISEYSSLSTEDFLQAAESLEDETSIKYHYLEDGFQTLEPVDTDGDGVDELVMISFGLTSDSGTSYSFKRLGFDEDNGAVIELPDNFQAVLPGYIIVSGHLSPFRRSYYWGNFRGDGKVMALAISYSSNGYGNNQTCYFSLIDFEAKSCITNQTNLFSFPFGEDRTVYCLDIDGDGMTELCHATTSGTVVYKLGSNNQFYVHDIIPLLSSYIIDSEDTYFTDINADGYIDVINAGNSYWNSYINTGNGFVWSIIHDLTPKAAGDVVFFFDINRDGYPDVLRINDTSFTYSINNSAHGFGAFLDTYSAIIDSEGILPANIVDKGWMSSFIKVNGSSINGYSFTTSIPELRHLVQSQDSYGKIVRSSYKYLPNASLNWTDNPTGISAADGYQLRVLPIYVLTGSKGFLSSESNAPVFMEESYSWYDGVVNTRGLGFCGFSKNMKITSTDDRNVMSISKYDPQRMGVPTSTEQLLYFMGYPEIATEVYTWDNHSTTYGKLSPRLIQSVATNYLTGVNTTTTYSYDGFDYPRIINTSSRIGSSSNYITVRDERTYNHSNLPTKYVLGAVTEQSVIRGRMGDRTVFTYDTSFRPLTKTDCKVRITGPAAHPVYDYYQTERQRWTYDSHGNVLTEESSPYNATDYTGNTYTYDSSGRHLTSSTNALGQTITYSNFDKYGNPRTVTDYRSRIKTSSFDSWGNQTKTVYADGTVDSTATAWGGQGVYTATRTVTGKPSTIVHYDALSREIRSGNQRFNGQWQYTDAEYNLRGVVKKVSLPFTGSTPTYWNTYTFDDYGRKKKYSEASGRVSRWSYSLTSVTEIKDSITVTRTTNAMGELVSVTDAAGTITYTLRDDGQPSSVSAPGGATTTFNYDNYGRRTKITDPSAGERSTAYTYNADGSSVVTETNAIGSIATNYDKYGRVTGITRTGTGAFNTTYTYDSYGRLSSVSSTNSTSEEYTYDAYDRVSTVKETVPDSKWLQKTCTYGAGGNVSSIAYTSQSGYITTESYSYTNGHNTSISLPNGTNVLTLSAENGLGQPTSASSGDVSRIYVYSQFGFPIARMLMYHGSTRQNLHTTFDPATGNLTSRYDASHGTPYVTEYFTYDALGRLTSDYTGSISYDIKGNLTSITGVGTMTYPDSAHPYRISRLNASDVSVTRPNPQTVTYTVFDRPAAITESGPPVTAFTYNADYERVKMQTSVYGTAVTKKYYIGDCYEREETSSSTTERLFLGGDAYSAPMVLQRTGGTGAWTPYVIGRDYLGSITNIITTDGTSVAEYSYDAWGRMRDPQTLTPYASTSQPSLFLGRGYCGHEHLSSYGLINMNARLYDPVLGRFLTPDPYVQSPDFSQNFNRYAYALNNPLKYTDPSGEIFGIDDALFWGIVAGTVIGAYTGGLMANNGNFIPWNWNYNARKTWVYMFSGALVGGFSAYAGAAIAVSGIPMANTLSTMYSSFAGSLGTMLYTGGKTPVSMSFGFASYDFTNGQWGWLGKKGNSVPQNIGYLLGLTRNIKDVNDLIDKTIVRLYTQIYEDNNGTISFDAISHSGIADENKTTLLSFGPSGDYKPKGNPETLFDFAFRVRRGSFQFVIPFDYSIATSTFQINKDLFSLITKVGRLVPYQGITSNCVNWASFALWLNGIPNIGIHPFLLHGSIMLYNTGIYNTIPYVLQFYY